LFCGSHRAPDDDFPYFVNMRGERHKQL